VSERTWGFIRNWRQDTGNKRAKRLGAYFSPVLLVSLVSLFVVGLRTMGIINKKMKGTHEQIFTNMQKDLTANKEMSHQTFSREIC